MASGLYLEAQNTVYGTSGNKYLNKNHVSFLPSVGKQNSVHLWKMDSKAFMDGLLREISTISWKQSVLISFAFLIKLWKAKSC